MSAVTYYIALIHETDASYGVSFPDVPGVITGAGTIDEAMRKASEVLEFAAENWLEDTGQEFPRPRTIDELRSDPQFQEDSIDAVIAAVPFRAEVEAAE